MRAARSFRLGPLLLLEARVVPSAGITRQIALPTQLPAANIAATLSPSDMVPGAPAAPVGGNTFPLSISATLQIGTPVYEQRVITDSTSVAPRIVDRLIVPQGGGVSVTTEWIERKNNGGLVMTVDVESVTGATVTHRITTTLPTGKVQTEVQTAVHSGTTTTHTNVTTLASGVVKTNQYTDIRQGKTHLITNGSEPGPNGTTETYSGTRYTVGKTTYTIETYFVGSHKIKHTESVVTSLGALGSSETLTTTRPHHKVKVTSSSTVVYRLNPPVS